MEAREVRGTDLRIARLVLGTMTFGAQVDERAAREMVDESLEAGINMVDTANAYNQGRAESVLGRALRDRRDDLLVSTKVFASMGDGPDDGGLTRAAIDKAISASLERLQTDHVDVYFLHQPDWQTPIDETLEAMNDLVDAGKARYVGVSNYAAWQIADIDCRSRRGGWAPVVISQPMYNLLARRIEEEYAACSKALGLFDIVYNPLAGGLLSGKHRLDSPPEEGRFAMEMYRERYWDRAHFDAVADLAEAAEGAGLSLIELSFRWLLAQPLVDSVLVGASDMDQLRANLAAGEGGALDDDLVARCDEVWRRLRGAAAAYNR